MTDAISMKNQFLAQVAQIDNQIMDLKDQMVEALQKAVDLDMNTNGSISDITRQFIETFHFKIEDGMVRSENMNYGQEHVKEQRENRPQTQKKKTVTQAQLDSMIAEHREKQSVGNYETLDLSNCIFDNVTFTGNYSDVSFMNSEMEKCSFKGFQAENVLLSRADISNSMFDNCSINNSILTHANMGFSEIVNTTYTNCSFREASLVGSNLQKSELNGCDLDNAIVSDTHFLYVIAHACTGAETIDFTTYSRDPDRYRAEFANTFITPDITIEYKALPQNEVSINISTKNGEVSQNVAKIDYDIDTHAINSIEPVTEPSELLDRAIRAIKPDILKEFQMQQYENKAIVSPSVIVHLSESINFDSDKLYDLKEFADRIASYGKENADKANFYEKVQFSIVFQNDEGQVKTWQDRYDLREDKDSLIERICHSDIFNQTEKKALVDYIVKGKAYVADKIPMLDNDQHPIVAVETTEDYENPKIGFCTYQNPDSRAGVRYRLVAVGENGKLFPYPQENSFFVNRDSCAMYLSLHPELNVINYDRIIDLSSTKQSMLMKEAQTNQKQNTAEPHKEASEKPAEQPKASKENPPGRQNEKPAYAAYVYVKGKETQKPVRVTGSSAEKIIELCQKWNQERSGDNQLGTAYMQKYNPQTKEYGHIGKYDVKTGNDITPIYLKKPSNLNKEQFDKTVELFRKNGARYSSKQKAWYITKQQLDVPAFKAYLPNQPGSKTNVHDSLDRNKSRLENSSQQKHHESRKKDGPAL